MAAPRIDLVMSESSVSIANNTSVVKGSLYYYGNGETYNAAAPCKITIDGKSRSFTASVSTSTSKKLLGTYSVTVKHDSDGSKKVAYSATCDASAYYGPSKDSGTFTCTTIPRATTPSVSPSSAPLGDSIKISCPRKSSSFTHDLTYKLGNKKGTIATGVGTSKTWTIPTSLASALPSNVSGTMTVTCKTKNGSTTIGSKTDTVTVTVPNATPYVPTISGATFMELTSGLAAKFGVFVKDKSKIKISVTREAGDGASVKQTAVKLDGSTYSGQTSETNVIRTAGDLTAAVTVTDSRGRKASKNYTVKVADYFEPKLSSLTVVRCDQSGAEDADGAYMRIDYSVSVAPVENKNDRNLVIKYKKQSESDYQSQTVNLDAYSKTGNVVIAASTESSYDVLVELSDYFITVSQQLGLSTAYTLIDYHKSGRGISFGKVSEAADTFEVAMNTILFRGVDMAFSDEFIDKWEALLGVQTAEEVVV